MATFLLRKGDVSQTETIAKKPHTEYYRTIRTGSFTGAYNADYNTLVSNSYTTAQNTMGSSISMPWPAVTNSYYADHYGSYVDHIQSYANNGYWIVDCQFEIVRAPTKNNGGSKTPLLTANHLIISRRSCSVCHNDY